MQIPGPSAQALLPVRIAETTYLPCYEQVALQKSNFAEAEFVPRSNYWPALDIAKLKIKPEEATNLSHKSPL
jgi:hypothetical protein